MKILDKLYFYFKETFSRYDEGYDNGYDQGELNGYQIARAELQQEIVCRLDEMNPHFSDESFQLGYRHAIAVVKGEAE